MKFRPALTLIELLLVISIISVLSTATYVLTSGFRNSQSLTNSADEVVTAVRRAHVFSRESKDDKDWGIKKKTNTMFALESRGETGTSEVYEYQLLDPTVFSSGSFEIWFDQGSGETAADTSIMVKAPNGKTKTIHITQSGLVEIQ